MRKITVEHDPDRDTLSYLGVYEWNTQTEEVSEFPWTYNQKETCYILEGEATVTPDGGEPVPIGKGDLVVFPVGMICTWNVTKDLKKRYKFG